MVACLYILYSVLYAAQTPGQLPIVHKPQRMRATRQYRHLLSNRCTKRASTLLDGTRTYTCCSRSSFTSAPTCLNDIAPPQVGAMSSAKFPQILQPPKINTGSPTYDEWKSARGVNWRYHAVNPVSPTQTRDRHQPLKHWRQ